MAKELTFEQQARAKLLEGINKLAKAVKITAGPKGRNALIEKKYGAPLIVNDGVTIAREIELKDPVENMGAKLIAEAAISTNDIAGDGTTTATILTHEIVNKAIEAINNGTNPVNLRIGIENAAKLVSEYLTSVSKPIKSIDEISQVGAISSGSKFIGELIAEAMDIVGPSGVISIDDAKSFDTTLDTTDGLEFKGGYSSPYMVTDSEKMLSELANPKILVSLNKINTVKEILPLLEASVESSAPLLIVASDIAEDVVTALAINKLRGTLNVVSVKCAEFGEAQKNTLEDLAISVNTILVDSTAGIEFKDLELNKLGSAEKVIISKDKTTVINGACHKDVLAKYLNNLKAKSANLTSKYDKERITKRIANLSNGVAVIHVGGATEVAQKELKLRIEDALNSTKAAVEEGIVAGGGIALMNAIEVLKQVKESNPEIALGYEIVRSSLTAPARQIIENAGQNSSKIINNIINSKQLGYGYNAETNEFVNMINNGIIDPTKVTKTALEKACSVAALLITTEVAINDELKEEKPSLNHL